MKSKTQSILPLTLLVIGLALTWPAPGATWTNFAGTARWGGVANWTPNTPPNADGAEANFQVDVPANLTVSVVKSDGTGNYTPSLSTLKLGDTNGSSSITFDKGGVTTSRLHFTNSTGRVLIEKKGDGNDTMSVGALRAYNNNFDVVFAGGAGTLTFACEIAQQSPYVTTWTVKGPGTLIVNGSAAFTHSGGTVIDQATLQIDNANRLGAAGGSVTIGNNGTLRANGSGANINITLDAGRNVLLKGGGTANFSTVLAGQSLTVLGPVTSDPGSPAALVLNGPGTLGLSGACTYASDTTVAGGKLLLSGTINNGAKLTVVSNASLALNFPAGNPSSIPITVGTLEPSNGMVLEISGAMMTGGQFPLIKYSTLGGDGFGALAANLALSPGLFATLVDNSANHTIDLNISLAVNSLQWVGMTNDAFGTPYVNTNWDLNVSANWFSLTTFNSSKFTEPTPGVGDIVVFDDSSLYPTVNLVGTLRPALVRVTNNLAYVFGGSGTLAGAGKLVKQGPGILTIAGPHAYSGGTSNAGGTIRVGHNEALGSGLVAFNSTDARLSSTDTTARSVTNGVLITLATALGDPVNTGAITLSGPINFNAAARNITCDSEVLMTGGSSNGQLNKLGKGTLTLRGIHDWTGDAEIRDGTMVLDGVLTNSGAVRPDSSVSNGVAVLQVNPGATLVLTSAGANMRSGYDGAATATNIVNFAGELYMPNATPPNGRIYLGAGGALGVFNLQAASRAYAYQVQRAANLAEFNFDGGTLIATTNNTAFMQGLTEVHVRNGGATIDSGPWAITIAQSLLAQGAGGLTKQGPGSLVLTGTNTYTGPTTVSAGTLVLSTAHSGPGSISVSDAATLGILASGGSPSMTAPSLTLGSGTAIQFSGLNGDPSVAPLVVSGLLQAGGPVTISVSGYSLSPGQFPLIRYGSISGAANLTSNPPLLQQGVVGTLVNTGTSIDLLITAVSPLTWTGAQGSPWDINFTQNWKVFGTNTVYLDGDNVLFDDSAASTVVDVSTLVSPGAFTVSNHLVTYYFQGTNGIDGGATFIKDGTGVLVLTNVGANTYSGDTRIKAGTLILGESDIPNGAGKGNLFLDGTLDLFGLGETVNGLTGGAAGMVTNSGPTAASFSFGGNNQGGTFAGRFADDGVNTLSVTKSGTGTALLTGQSTHLGGTTVSNGKLQIASEAALGRGPVTLNNGLLSSGGSTALAITNTLAFAANGSLGDVAPYNGTLTFSGLIDFGGTDRYVTNASPVIFSGWLTNAGLEGKYGAGELRFLNSTGSISGNAEVRQGSIVYDHSTLDKPGGGLRIACMDTNGTARMVVTNGASLHVVGNASNIRIGYGAAPISEVTATNIAEVAGTITFDLGNSDSSQIRMSESCARAILNLWPGGRINLRRFSDQWPGISEVNFRGGTLQPLASTNNFLEGMDEVYLYQDGLTIDTAGSDITIAQSLLAPLAGPSGGLTKTGAGMLLMNGNSTYTNTTFVNGGSLGGSGTLSSPVLVGPAGTLSPGDGLGTLTIISSLTLQGTTFMEVNKDFSSRDMIAGVTTLTYGGTLVVTNQGATPLAEGDTFPVFTANTYAGTFAYMQPPGPGLAWDASSLSTGTLRVVKGTVVTPTNLTWSVTGSTLEISWPATHLGWLLQSQTNALNSGIGNIWFPVPSSTSTNRMFIPIDVTKGTVFFRLISQ